MELFKFIFNFSNYCRSVSKIWWKFICKWWII